MLLEASEESTESKEHGGGRIVWSVRYALEGEEDNVSLAGPFQTGQQQQQALHHHHHAGERKKLQAHLQIQKDDIQAVLPISKVRGPLSRAGMDPLSSAPIVGGLSSRAARAEFAATIRTRRRVISPSKRRASARGVSQFVAMLERLRAPIPFGGIFQRLAELIKL